MAKKSHELHEITQQAVIFDGLLCYFMATTTLGIAHSKGAAFWSRCIYVKMLILPAQFAIALRTSKEAMT
jgi:hypothetical protein